jgi:hypothetical protein
MAHFESQSLGSSLNGVDSSTKGFLLHHIKSDNGLDDHGSMIGSERLCSSSEAPFARSLALTKMTQRMRAILRVLVHRELRRCECEKSVDERTTAPANTALASWPLEPLYLFGPPLS